MALQHLSDLDAAGQSSKLREAEKMLGWKHSSGSWLHDDNLRSICKPTFVHYDEMHIYWSNGVVSQEIGLWWEAATAAGACSSDLSAFLASGWQHCRKAFHVARAQMLKLVSAHLLKPGADYRGDSTQCLQLLPLLAYFDHAVLHGRIPLQSASLQALYAVTVAVLALKDDPRAADGHLQDLQSAHLSAFIAAYGVAATRPKHHFAFHIQPQVESCNVLLDCFTCERKHKVYKSFIALSLKSLSALDSSALLRFLEQDMGKLESSDVFCNGCLLGRKVDVQPPLEEKWSSLNFANRARFNFHEISAGDIIVLRPGKVCRIEAATIAHGRLHFLLAMYRPVRRQGCFSWWAPAGVRSLVDLSTVSTRRASWHTEDGGLLLLLP